MGGRAAELLLSRPGLEAAGASSECLKYTGRCRPNALPNNQITGRDREGDPYYPNCIMIPQSPVAGFSWRSPCR